MTKVNKEKFFQNIVCKLFIYIEFEVSHAFKDFQKSKVCKFFLNSSDEIVENHSKNWQMAL